jgi:hypothetical protein
MQRAMLERKKTDWRLRLQRVAKAKLAALQYRRTGKIVRQLAEKSKGISGAFILLNRSNRLRLPASEYNQDNKHPGGALGCQT